MTEGFFRKASYIKQKIPHKESLHRLAAVPLPFQGRLIVYIGSLEKGAGSRRLTEGFFCVTETLTKDFTEPLHQLANAASNKG